MRLIHLTYLTLLLLTPTSAPATLITGSLLASYGSDNTILASYGSDNTTLASNSQLLPNSPTATSSVTVGSLISSGAAAQANLPTGTLAVAGAANSSSNYPADPLTYNNAGNAILTYQDTLTVQSSTLPTGTPVQITIAAQLAYTQSATHTIPSNIDIHNNDATTQIIFTLAADSGSLNGSFSETDQSFFDPVSPTTLQQGIFTNPHVEQIISATVGSTISFYAELKTYNSTSVALFNNTNQSAATLSSAALALGFSATDATVTPALTFSPNATPDITLFSPALNQTMPSLDNASPSIAQAALLSTPLPEPAALCLLLPLLFRRRR